MKTIWRILSSMLIPTQLVLALNFAVPAMAAGCDDITELSQAPPSESSAFQREVPLYFQTDYPDSRYGYGTVASSGCGITSLAMVATYLTGFTYLPDTLAKYFGSHGENNIQRLEYGSDQLQLPWKKAKDIHEVFSALEEGNIVIALMSSDSIFTNSQHFITLAGLNDRGRIMVNDPYEPNYENWQLKNAFRDGFSEGDIMCGFSGGWIYDVKAMPENPFPYVDNTVTMETRYPQIHLNWAEQQLLAKVIWAEARGESQEGQQAVAEVILNRMASKAFADTLEGVVFAEGQFATTEILESAKPSQVQYEAIERALTGLPVLPLDVVYFARAAKTNSVWGKIGAHIFCFPEDYYEGQ